MTLCSDLGRELAEPLAGTAPVAAWWLVVEQPGPWGAKALTQSHLDPSLGRDLDAAAAEHGGRVALVRRPRRHPDTHHPAAHRVWLAGTTPGATFLLGGWLPSPDALRSLDFAALGAGSPAGLPELRPETEPLLLVCTNGRRDLCCAVKGRALVAGLRDDVLGRVWETTHLGGHRFAPTAVLLPHGVMYGRMDDKLALLLVEEARAGRFLDDGYRGRSTFERPGQSAEAAVRRLLGHTGLDDLTVSSLVPVADRAWDAVVEHRDGRSWTVAVRAEEQQPPRPESCGKSPVTPIAYRADVPVPQ
ncbi:sucrase ferredoxin [Jiangella rhizosphaerae]|uniref:Sucrase ferredoxin n=1 Tax=Jiangella rhizosphaerae TaxID=2293569 RepID=A0A418KMF8_9ACTN|nr:sucrase ferredoxin [Jiangella rhizosphaerae]RIQ19553.1 sucrase ferredoxin [Jiangella rhizosphaerae]